MVLGRGNWLHRTLRRKKAAFSGEARIGLALGGGFARGIAHVGILRVLERENIPIHCVTGVSAGAIVAAAFASGATSEEIGRIGSAMRFEEMRIPLGVVATDLRKGIPVLFRDKGEVAPAIRASCSYPGLFRPVEYDGRILVDGAMTVEVPALLARKMGATRVISVCIPMSV